MTAAPAILASAPVTNWPERAALTLLVVAVIAVVLVLMRRGWVRRGRRQDDILPLPRVPALPTTSERGTETEGTQVLDVPARYLGATRSGDWLDRVVVHGLGVPSAARVTVTSAGVWVVRDGAPDLFVAADRVAGVRHDRGAAGRVLEKDGVLVITWRHGEQLIDLGLRVRDVVAAESVRAAAATLVLPQRPATDQQHRSTSSLSATTPGDTA
jgi:hypothetical protein